MTGHRALEKKQITQGNNRKVQNPSGSHPKDVVFYILFFFYIRQIERLFEEIQNYLYICSSKNIIMTQELNLRIKQIILSTLFILWGAIHLQANTNESAINH